MFVDIESIKLCQVNTDLSVLKSQNKCSRKWCNALPWSFGMMLVSGGSAMHLY